MNSTVGTNILRIRERIAEAALRSGRRPADVRLMAVTKTVDDGRIAEAIAAGVDMIGENYVQEGRRKIEKLGKSVEWHMIGHLQTNKAKYAVRLFDLIHSVDRIELARELSRRSVLDGTITPVLLEVNTGGENTKSGVSPAQVVEFARAVAVLPNLSVQGLMTMPPWFDDPEEARPFFRSLRAFRDRIAGERIPGVEMRELSMGMTQDFDVAVEEGSTIVRIGRAIFGERPSREESP